VQKHLHLNISNFKVTLLAEFHKGKLTMFESHQAADAHHNDSDSQSDHEMQATESEAEVEKHPVSSKGKTGPGSFKGKKVVVKKAKKEKKFKKVSK